MCKIISEEMRFPTELSKKKKKWMTFECVSCNQIASKWYELRSWNCKCTHCSKGGFTSTDFIEKSKVIHGDTYDYSKTVYVNKRTSVTLICAVHGEFTQRPSEHLEGHGCRKCSDVVRGQLQFLDKSEWETRILKYPLITFKDINQVQSYHRNVDLVCEVHGEFTVQLGKVGQAKYLCPNCAWFNHKPQSIRTNLIGTQATLYYVYIPKIDMYKLGVTVQPLGARFSGHDYKLLLTHELEYTRGLALEHKLHTTLKDFRYQGTKRLLSVGGSTELYKIDIFYYLERALRQ